MIAREAGLEPLADLLLADPSMAPEARALPFVDPERGVADAAAALDGARWILIERFAEDPELVGTLREYLWAHADLRSKVIDGKEEEGIKFSDYFSARELFRTIPSHRALALFRGRKDGYLKIELSLPEAEEERFAARLPTAPEAIIARRTGIDLARGASPRPGDAWLQETVRACWHAKLSVHLETDLMTTIREAAELEAIRVFGTNLRDLLLAAPAGTRPTLGLDPGLRTGREGGRGRRHGKAGRHGHHLSARAAQRVGPVASPCSPRSRRATTSSSSASATAPPRAKPTSWCRT